MSYCFPFEKCLSLEYERIFIFGAGEIGSYFQKQIDDNKWAGTNLGFIDNYLKKENASEIVNRIGLNTPEILKTTKYDGIVLACSYHLIPEICESLFNIGVDCKQIVLPEINVNSFTPNIGDRWDSYYEKAEKANDIQLEMYFIPLLSKYEISFSRVLDFPSGRGRMAESMNKTYSEQIEKFVCCDANHEAINFCRERFANNGKFGFIVNKVDEWECIPFDFKNNSFTFVYSWDAMVHFSYKWLDFYIGEFYRILENNGYVFIHHSNLSATNVKVDNGKSDAFNKNPDWRSLISAKDIRHISEKHGFTVVEQNVIDWSIPNLDCISLLRK